MRKRNNQLKMLANIAKQRLMKGEYKESEEKQTFVPKVSSYFIKNASAMKKITAKIEYVKISGKIDNEFEERVRDLLETDYYSLNPFSKLIDIELYNSLNDIEKQSYMLSLAEKYNDVRQKYMEGEKTAI